MFNYLVLCIPLNVRYTTSHTLVLRSLKTLKTFIYLLATYSLPSSISVVFFFLFLFLETLFLHSSFSACEPRLKSGDTYGNSLSFFTFTSSCKSVKNREICAQTAYTPLHIAVFLSFFIFFSANFQR